MTHHIIQTDAAPAAEGTASQGVSYGALIFTSLQVARDPRSGMLSGSDHAAQAHRCLCNAQAILEAAGSSLAGILRLTIYLTDLRALAAVDAICADFFPADPPARGVVEVRALPHDALVGIEVIAARH